MMTSLKLIEYIRTSSNVAAVDATARPGQVRVYAAQATGPAEWQVVSVMRGSACPVAPRGVAWPAGEGRGRARKECVVFASGETNAFKRRGYTMAA